MITLARRGDILMSHLWLRSQVWIWRHVSRPLYRWRWWLLAYAVVFSALDLVITQQVLTMVAGLTGTQPAEANPIMAPIILSWWAWPVRVGLPLVFLLRDVHPRKVTTNVSKAAFAATLYGAVVAWNMHIAVTVQGALA